MECGLASCPQLQQPSQAPQPEAGPGDVEGAEAVLPESVPPLQGPRSHQQSSFLGDFYWAGRMGNNWNADPSVCCCHADSDWVDFEWWDWSLINLIRLGLAKPLSQLGWTPETLDQHKGKTCTGSFLIGCGPF